MISRWSYKIHESINKLAFSPLGITRSQWINTRWVWSCYTLNIINPRTSIRLGNQPINRRWLSIDIMSWRRKLKWMVLTWCVRSVTKIALQSKHGWRDISCSWVIWLLARALLWRHNGTDGVSNHQPYDCLLNRLFRHRSKKTSKLRVTGPCAGNSPETGEFPAQMSSNAENVSI